MLVPLLLLPLIVLAEKAFLFHTLQPDIVKLAREHGRAAYLEYIEQTSNDTLEIRQELFDEFYSRCDHLAFRQAKKIAQWTRTKGRPDDYKRLIHLGMQPFVAKFATLPERFIIDGVRQLCSKIEVQLQCQRGFGESRSKVWGGVDEWRRRDGLSAELVATACAPAIPHLQCIGHAVAAWTAPCAEKMAAYNNSRHAVGRRIADMHFNTTEYIEQLTDESALLDATDLFLPLEFSLNSILTGTLKRIAKQEGEKCVALQSVLKCGLHHVAKKCGPATANLLKRLTLVAYLNQERREPLASQFRTFDIPAHPLCTALHPDIVT